MAITYEPNRAQSEILLAESVSEGAAMNTISVRLKVAGFGAEEVKRAADAAILSADIFSVRLSDGKFVPCAPDMSAVLPPMTEEELCAHIGKGDRTPIPLDGPLYSAEVIPAADGTVLYARFHHVLLDGRGMCLFAQSVLDALAGASPRSSVFFCRESAPAAEDGYWETALKGLPPETAVYPDEARGYDKFTLWQDLDEKLVENAAKFARGQGVNLPYVFLAAQAYYLATATDTDEATILMPRLNRTKEQAHTLGCYVLLVPVRIRLGGCEDFGELCRRAQAAAREASMHKDVGFSRILHSAHGVSLNYGFNYYDFTLSSAIPHTLSFSVAGATRSHLVWNLFAGEKLRCSFDCRSGVYDERRARYFIEGISEVLREGMGGKPLAQISVVGADERAALEGICGPSVPVEEGETIPALLRAAALRYADLPALYAGDKQLTFRELDGVSDDIARALVARGVKPGDKVAFMLKRDIRLLPALFGISKAGAAFIPVDPAYPKERIDYILRDSGVTHLITSRETGNGLDIDELLKGADASLPAIAQGATAYLIYTSGTTGKPKGVMLSHRGIANIVKAENNPFNRFFAAHCSGITAIGSVCFDISLYEFFTALFNGKFVELADEDGMIDPQRLAATISAHGADALHCTPSRLASYLRDPRFVRAAAGVKAVLSAGEVLPQALIFELKKLGVRIFNGYGPTETTIGATITEEGDSLSIGRPIANMGVFILGKEGKTLPYGAAGEICIYGLGLGQGYLNRPEETAKRFCERCGRAVYRTGDIGRLTEDGRLLYLGRCDRQVKLRGLRIELPEIESAMLSCPGVKQAACIVKKSDHSEHLVAFYTADGDLDGELKAHISGTLTAYMVPDVFRRLPAMPQTEGGKTDYKKLAEENVEFHREFRAPQSEAERIICEAFSSVLGVGSIGLDDDFFELGGDSLGAMELMLAIERAFNGKAPEYRDIYRYPTPGQLASKLSMEGESEAYPTEKLDYSGIDDYLSGRGKCAGKPIGKVLLTGATGFLGSHILAELLRREDCEKVYCLVRPRTKASVMKRVRSSLFYYIEDDFMEEGKWEAVEGDLTSTNLFTEPFHEKVDIVLNCAANVAHFGYKDELSGVNEVGVINLIAFAERVGARFCQISTISSGGMASVEEASKLLFTEDKFFIHQRIYNEYVYTKYKAEYALLRAAVDEGLDVQIFRVGNLQGRISDGEFQMNLRSNGFTRRLAAYIDIGAAPRSVYDSTVEFSPVDEVARMVTGLIAAGERGAFHVCPPQETEFKRLFAALGKMGKPVRPLPDEEFEQLIAELKQTGEHSASVEILSIERSEGYVYIPISRTFTVERLASLGLEWKEITDAYLEKYLAALGGMDMF